jgi:hypothetical protein
MSVYPTAKAPKTQPKAASVMPSSPDMSLLAAEIQTRSTMVKNESEHKQATTYPRREGPFALLDTPVNGLGVKLVSWINATSPELECIPAPICNRFPRSCQDINIGKSKLRCWGPILFLELFLISITMSGA